MGNWSCIADDDILIEDMPEQADVENEFNFHSNDGIGAVKYDAQVEVDASSIYKATCVKQAFSTTPLSKDRLQHVQGMSSVSNNSASSSRDMIFVGDPVVASDNSVVFIGNVINSSGSQIRS